MKFRPLAIEGLALVSLTLVALAGCARRAPEPPPEPAPTRMPSPPYLSLPPSGPMPAHLSDTGAFADTAALVPNPALIAYDVNVPFWAGPADKRRWIAVPAGERIHFSESGAWGFPAGTVFVKHFEQDGRRLETRLLACGADGSVTGATYRWRADQAEADLVETGRRDGDWYYPGPDDCRKCHLPAAGGALGVNTRQLNRGGQVAEWARLGLFDHPPSDVEALPRLAAADSGRPVEDRARSYLDANCGYCHRPGGAVADFDARYDTPLERQGLVNAPARINFGIDRARVIAPNDPWRSVALVRMATPEQTRMPPLGHAVADQHGLELLTAWVRSLPGPPVVAPPTVTPAGGDFAGPVRVELHHPDPAAVVRYTLDGSAPTAASAVYAGPIDLKSPATVRARAYRADHAPSVTVQETYIVGD